MPGDQHRVVTIGESMLQVTPSPIGSLSEAITATLSVAGAESTVARYLAGLGHHTVWISAVGDDPIGERIVSDIHSSGVDTALVTRNPSAPSGVYFKDGRPGGTTAVHYYRSGSAASRMNTDSIGDIVFYSSDLIHLSGITPALSLGCSELVDAGIQKAHEAGARVSFDVNYRSRLWGKAEAASALVDLANQADIAFVGLDEAHELWGTASADAVREVLHEPNILVVKDGAIGATAYQGTSQTVEPALVVEVAEPIGAGDAFAAGFLHGVLTEVSISTSLHYGHMLAASSLTTTADVGRIPHDLPRATQGSVDLR